MTMSAKDLFFFMSVDHVGVGLANRSQAEPHREDDPDETHVYVGAIVRVK